METRIVQQKEDFKQNIRQLSYKQQQKKYNVKNWKKPDERQQGTQDLNTHGVQDTGGHNLGGKGDHKGESKNPKISMETKPTKLGIKCVSVQ